MKMDFLAHSSRVRALAAASTFAWTAGSLLSMLFVLFVLFVLLWCLLHFLWLWMCLKLWRLNLFLFSYKAFLLLLARLGFCTNLFCLSQRSLMEKGLLVLRLQSVPGKAIITSEKLKIKEMWCSRLYYLLGFINLMRFKYLLWRRHNNTRKNL